MLRIRSLYLAAVVLVSTATLGAAQIPGSFLAAPGTVTLAAAKGESFAMTLSSTVQASALAIADSTAGASQAFSGSVVLTPDWDLTNNRVVTVYAYVSTPFTSASSSLASSLLEASATGGSGSANGSWNAFASTVDGYANAVTLTQVTATGANKKASGATERLTVGLRLNTTNTYVEPGNYSAVVTFAARVQ
jgi:hypothetical protein